MAPCRVKWKPALLAALAGLPVVCFGAPPLQVNGAAGCDDIGGVPYYCRIQAAINVANDGDTIAIAAGTYAERLTITKSVELAGAGADQTIIDAGHSGRPVTIFNNVVVQLSGLTVENGETSFGGGGIFLEASNSLSIIDCEVRNNVATGGTDGGAIYSSGTLTIEGTRITGNLTGGNGGALYNSGSAANIVNSLIDHNQGFNGGAIYSDTPVGIANSTISDNTATGEGGALYKNNGNATLTNATVAGNTAAGAVGGIHNQALAITLQNSLVAGNSGSGGNRDCGAGVGATFLSLGHNYVGTVGGCAISGTGDLLDQGAVGAKLAPLADNGGRTLTRALLAGSAAIDAGAGCGTEDQRGVARPIDGDGDGTATCDIGAFEASAPDDGGGNGDDDTGGGGGGGDSVLFWLLIAGAGWRRRSRTEFIRHAATRF